MNMKVGDIYWFNVTYNGLTEARPVVIVDIINDQAVFVIYASITGSAIKKFEGKYDQWKSPIFKWQEAGLKKPSYVKANTLAYADVKDFNPNDYMGTIDPNDLKNAQKLIKSYINSLK